MKRTMVVCTLFFSIACLTPIAIADSYTPSHYCTKPFKPYQFNSQYEVNSYEASVSSYKSCIELFVEDQNEAARKHRDAAKMAINEWNSFARIGY